MTRARSSQRRPAGLTPGFDFAPAQRPAPPEQRLAPAAQQPLPSPAAAEASAVRLALPWYAPCARCGRTATLGEMWFDRAGTGPWLCHPSSFRGLPGCRAGVLDAYRDGGSA